MAATREDLRRNIQPGSTEFGQRQQLEAGIGQLPPQAANPRMAAAMGSSLGIPSNPLDPLLGGELPSSGELTSGLSVGPGPGPAREEAPDGRVERLRQIALTAQSPVLREMARRSLRSTVRSRRRGG